MFYYACVIIAFMVALLTPAFSTVVVIATGNKGKLRDFAAAARPFGISVHGLPDFASLPPAVENAPTFEANAAKKAEYYSQFAPGRLVLADDSGLAVDALGGAPGVHSARYALADEHQTEDERALPHENSPDSDNNAKLLREMRDVSDPERGAQFVCVVAVARNGRLEACFHGIVRGVILREPRGNQGFGYDPLFCIPQLAKTFAELSPEQKAEFSHRGQAFRKFLKWHSEQLNLTH